MSDELHVTPLGVPYYIEGWVRGMYKKGTRVRKVNTLPGDVFPDGTLGTVISAIRHPSQEEGGYFLYWDLIPNLPVFVAESRVKEID